MISRANLGEESAHVVRRAAIISLIAAAAALLVGFVFGAPIIGIGIAIGLAMSAGNGIVTNKLVGNGLPVIATSMLRLMVLSVLAVGIGLVFFGIRHVWTVVLGVALAQFVLAGMAALAMSKK